MANSSSPESNMLYQWVVTPDEFQHGQEHAIPLEEIQRRSKEAIELGVIRLAIRGESKFAVEFAPVFNHKTSTAGRTATEATETDAYARMRLRWTNLVYPGRSRYLNTPPYTINRRGMIVNEAKRQHLQSLGGHVSVDDPRLVEGYIVDPEYAWAAGASLPVGQAREFISEARFHQIYIPMPGFAPQIVE